MAIEHTEATTARGSGHGHLDVAVHDVADLRARYPDWDSLPKDRKAELVRDVDPVHEQHVSNVQLNGFYRYLVDHFDRSQSTYDRTFEDFAVGDDGSVTAADDTHDPADEGLGNQIYQASVASNVDEGRDLFVNGFLDSTEANGETLREFAIIAVAAEAAADDVYVNHALFDPEIDKTSGNTVSIDVTLGWRPE